MGPCFYQDIELDISQNFQRTVTIMYYYWMCESSDASAVGTFISLSPDHLIVVMIGQLDEYGANSYLVNTFTVGYMTIRMIKDGLDYSF